MSKCPRAHCRPLQSSCNAVRAGKGRCVLLCRRMPTTRLQTSQETTQGAKSAGASPHQRPGPARAAAGSLTSSWRCPQTSMQPTATTLQARIQVWTLHTEPHAWKLLLQLYPRAMTDVKQLVHPMLSIIGHYIGISLTDDKGLHGTGTLAQEHANAVWVLPPPPGLLLQRYIPQTP